MSKILVVVESPGKTKKISSYLGSNFIVKASYGHIRDLIKSKEAIDVANNFKGKYHVLPDKQKVVNDLKATFSTCSDVYIASDGDREGEAIADSIAYVLQLKNAKRMVFFEITKKAIMEAIKKIGKININMVQSQMARRYMDRLLGFELSPLLSKTMNNFSTAGRVQSVVVKLVVERENEIKNFASELDYFLNGSFKIGETNIKTKGYVMTKLVQPLNGDTYKTKNKDDSKKLIDKLKQSKFFLYHTFMKPQKQSPPPPYTTSSLQQDASIRSGFPIKMTMEVAQKLYEGGYITYMRTDSVSLSDDCIKQCKEYILNNYGEKYYMMKQYENKNKGAQEAHEAIRPTDMFKDGPDDEVQQRLYNLIWNRTIASQMKPADFELTYIQIIGKVGTNINEEFFEGIIKKLKFEGYLLVYGSENSEEDPQDINIPKTGVQLDYETISCGQETTKPKGRFQEANLVKKLEKLGIGRPSTYANTISKIQERGYVEKKDIEGSKIKLNTFVLKENNVKETNKETKIGAEKGKLVPTSIGIKVVEYLENNFTNLMNYQFTANLEEDLDRIAEGKIVWHDVLKKFYDGFHPIVEKLLGEIKSTPLNLGKLLGKNSKGFEIYASTTSKGNVVKMIEYTKTGKTIKNTTYASLGDISVDEVSLEQAEELLKYPCVIGQYENKDVIICKGPYGLYIKYDNKNYPWKEQIEPSLDECINIINEKNKNIIGTISGKKKYEIRTGQYGPYIIVPTKGNTKFVSIPKNEDINNLTEQRIEEIIKESNKKKLFAKKK
jgi:DNA topoisomerase-1